MKRTIAHRGCLAAGAAAIIATTAGCSAILGAPGDRPSAAPPVPLTERVAPSLLVVVAAPNGTRQRIAQVITATARPREDINVLEADGRGRVVVASRSQAPVTVAAPGKPVPPAAGASSYQEARYEKALARWRGQVATDRHDASARTAEETRDWARALPLQAVLAPRPHGPAAAGLDEECSLAASAVSGLVDQARGQFGTRRVLLLGVTSLAGMPPAGELDGDDVIVLTAHLPRGAASSAQEDLIAAGAAGAAVIGPEVTLGQVEQLVTEGLSQHVVGEALSGRALFANDSSVLLPSAARVLAPLVGPLSRPGATGIVNGYASAPGSASHNQLLSEERAHAVAAFLEIRGVPRSRLQVIGHGASNLIAPGSSGDNRRVVVVIEESGSHGS